MTRFSTLLVVLAMLCLSCPTGFAAIGIRGENMAADREASKIAYDAGNWKTWELREVLQMKVKDVEARTGKKMRFGERIAFGLMKHGLKKQLRKAERRGESPQEFLGGFTFHLGGFLLGLILGVVGFVIALFINEDAWKSSLIGLAIWLVIILIFAIL